jgi:hypothetical protein|uniref:Uncharacterized protein n=1 Tax=Sphingobacterium sp. (strain 21) TaxID=743722 RepID=F4C7V1_SPHS2
MADIEPSPKGIQLSFFTKKKHKNMGEKNHTLSGCGKISHSKKQV